MIKIRSHIPLKLQRWKVQSKASLFCSQKGKGSSWQIIDEQSNEFWLAQSCSVDKCSFTMRSIISFGVACNSKQTFFHERLFTIIMSLKHKRSVLSIKDEQSIIFSMSRRKEGNNLWAEYGASKQQISDNRKNKETILKINALINWNPDPSLHHYKS